MARISSVRSKIFCDNVIRAVHGLNYSVEGRFSYMLGFPVDQRTYRPLYVLCMFFNFL